MKKCLLIIAIILSTMPVLASDWRYMENENYFNTNHISANINSPTKIYENAVKSTVYIETKNKQGETLHSGSGVIINTDGTIITCFHVIADADMIEVYLSDGSQYNVNGFKYINPLDDVAILTLNTTKTFIPIKINNSENLKIGEKIYTIASPQGYKFTFTDGMINQYTKDYIQFSAPVAYGSSGGALINSKGELIGIITSMLDLSEAQNINFAIPNKFFTSKMNLPAIKNNRMLSWTDFLVNNADSNQLKIYTAYSFNSENYELAYKSLKPFAKQANFPPDRYVLMGYLALYHSFSNELVEFNEVLLWFNKSLDAGYNIETSAFALAVLSPIGTILDISIAENLYLKSLNCLEKYPESYNKFFEIINNISYCKKENEDCVITNLATSFEYITELYKKEMKEELDNIDWFIKLEKRNENIDFNYFDIRNY